MAQAIREEYDLAQHLLQLGLLVAAGKPAPDQDVEGVVAIFQLICRPYWSRMWIIQELAMAGENVLIGCGNQSTTLVEVCHSQCLMFRLLIFC